MNFFSDVLPLIFTLIAIVLVLYLCYVFSKYLSKKVNNVSGLGNIRILERVALTQDKGLAVAEVCGKYYLIGFSNNSVEILKELDGDNLKTPQPTKAENFLEILNSTIKSGWDVKTVGRNFAKSGKSENPGKDTDKRDPDR